MTELPIASPSLLARTSLCQLSMVDTDFAGDVEIAAELGIGGIGVIEAKLADADGNAGRLRDAGLAASICATDILTILPLPEGSRFGGPSDLDARIAQMVDGVRRLAPLDPDTVFFVSGPAGERSEAQARAVVVDALRAAGAAAASSGTRIAIEPMREQVRDTWTIVSSLAETLDLLDEVGRDDVGIVFDTWHLWDSPDVHAMIATAHQRIFGVQIADYRVPDRGPRDRLIAGDGAADIPRLLAALRAAGYDGWYDMEVFSDDGRFGTAYPDSLWALGPREFARRQVAGFLRCWEQSE